MMTYSRETPIVFEDESWDKTNQNTHKKAGLKKSNRSKLYKLHTWVGFHLALLMTIVLATGTISTVSNEIDWLFQDDMRVTPGEEQVSWQTMTDAVRAYAPSSTIISFQSMKQDYLAYRAIVKNADNQSYFIHVNQWTGEVTGTTGVITVQRVFRDLHRYLFMPSIVGLPIVTTMAFILLISLYTGLKTARNWKTLMTRVRLSKGARVMIGDAHKAVGLWGSWFLMLMAASSIWYLAEFVSEVSAFISEDKSIAFEPERPSISNERLVAMGPIIETHNTNDIIQATKNAFPDLKKVSNIFYPTKPNQPISVLVESYNIILRDRANRLFLDAESLEPLKIQRSGDIGLAAWVNEIADPLHFGFFGGLITKGIWFVFGLGLTSLSVSGVYLTWRRLESKKVTRTQLGTMPIFILAGISAYVYWYPQYQTPKVIEPSAVFSHKLNDTIDVEVQVSTHGILKMADNDTADTNTQSARQIHLFVNAKNGYANVKNITLHSIGGENKYTNENQEFKKMKLKVFSSKSLYTAKLGVHELSGLQNIVAKVTMNTGDVFEVTIPLEKSI